ncbi:MAG: PEGA domain-containing protein [Candidatus Andersenbacteria bacterium]
MQRRSRNLLFAAAILTFVVAAPLVIFWARGYYLDTRRGEVVRTGMILIDTNVPRLDVTVDGQTSTTESDPVAVRGLLPGRHTVKLEREGFAAWQADLDVTAEQVTRVDNVVMVKTEPAQTTLAEGPVGAVAASPNGAYVLYVVTGGAHAGIWLHTINDGDADRRLVAAAGLGDKVSLASVDLLRWSEDGKATLIHAAARWWLLEPHVATPTPRALKALDSVAAANVQLDPSEPSTVFYRDADGTVWRWKTATKDAVPVAVASQTIAFTVAPPKLFVLTAAGTQLTLGTYDLRQAAPTIGAVASLAGAAPADLLVAEGGGQVAVRAADGSLNVLQHKGGTVAFTTVATDVDAARWSPDAALLAYRRGTEVWAYDVQPIGSDAPTFLVTRLATEPELRWYPDARHLVVTHGDATSTTVELLHVSRTAPLLATLLTFAGGTSPTVDAARRGADLLVVQVDGSTRRLVSAAVTLGAGD